VAAIFRARAAPCGQAFRPLIAKGGSYAVICGPVADVASRIVLTCARNGIAVYSPHTALDSAPNGLNDWLAGRCGVGAIRPIRPIAGCDVEGAGEGRIIELSSSTSLAELIARLKRELNVPALRVSLPTLAVPTARVTPEVARDFSERTLVRTVAVCAGSGSSVLPGAAADVWLTGEMSHHDCLSAAHKGITTILADHSNTERGFFLGPFSHSLQRALGEHARVIPSTLDADPLVLL
jgi:putative NIF3 family GTP cyclohydrolase 1 type 2